MVVSK